MSYKIIFHKECLNEDLKNLDKSVLILVLKQIKKISINPKFGDLLSGKLSGLYKLYVYKKKYRIVYELDLLNKIIKILAVNKRENKKVYKLVFKRIK